MNPRLNVRCCCIPEKILGTLELQSRYATRPGMVQLFLPLEIEAFKFDAKPDEQIPSKLRSIQIELRTFVDYSEGHRREELAVYSDDRPIEFWKQFPSFRPVTGEPG